MSRDLYLYDNDLTSLPSGVEALTALTYVGEGESARVGGRAEIGDAATHARAHPRICGMDRCTYGSMCVGGGTRARACAHVLTG